MIVDRALVGRWAIRVALSLSETSILEGHLLSLLNASTTPRSFEDPAFLLPVSMEDVYLSKAWFLCQVMS